jgi:protein-tyrosine phosphatase
MDISSITDEIYLGARIPAVEIKDLEPLGITLVISMLHEKTPPEYQQNGMPFLDLPSFDFPLLPISMKTLRKGVAAALPVIERGEKVLVYCKFGRHRSVVMAASILIALGYPSDEAMALIDRQRPEADPYIWYIKNRIKAYEVAFKVS